MDQSQPQSSLNPVPPSTPPPAATQAPVASPVPGSAPPSHQAATISTLSANFAKPLPAAAPRRRKLPIVFIIAGFIAVAAIGGMVAWIVQSKKKPATPAASDTISSTTLSPDQLSKITGQPIPGTNSQYLTVGAVASEFKGRVIVDNELKLNGTLNNGGQSTLANLTTTNATIDNLKVTGPFSINAANLSSDLSVAGATKLQTLTVQSLLSANGGLTVNGAGSFSGTLTAGTGNFRSGLTSGPLTLNGHLMTSGSTPLITGTSIVGTGGTVSISGNDTAGTIAINTGSNPAAGIMATITFRTPFSSTPRVILTPGSAAAGGSQYYATKTGNAFSIGLGAPSSGSNYSFDYLVVQ